ncbi:hypothetical protein VNO77_16957 [Canavalia gladiata]|uniref:Uncharacterized protein n=1 Tax=Canavalia gladiata TaxID=3824 RepID=A0AAN9LIU7_CANGL
MWVLNLKKWVFCFQFNGLDKGRGGGGGDKEDGDKDLIFCEENLSLQFERLSWRRKDWEAGVREEWWWLWWRMFIRASVIQLWGGTLSCRDAFRENFKHIGACIPRSAEEVVEEFESNKDELYGHGKDLRSGMRREMQRFFALWNFFLKGTVGSGIPVGCRNRFIPQSQFALNKTEVETLDA